MLNTCWLSRLYYRIIDDYVAAIVVVVVVVAVVAVVVADVVVADIVVLDVVALVIVVANVTGIVYVFCRRCIICTADLKILETTRPLVLQQVKH